MPGTARTPSATCSTRPSPRWSDDNRALDGVVQHIDFNRKVGQTSIKDATLQKLIDHFGKYRLRNEDFEFPDLLGAAYEYLIARVRRLRRQEGRRVLHPARRRPDDGPDRRAPQRAMRVYDPCSGSGGMLICAREYVEEHGDDFHDLSLYGQEYNGGYLGDLQDEHDPARDQQRGPRQRRHPGRPAAPARAVELLTLRPGAHQSAVLAELRAEGHGASRSDSRYGWAPETGKKADLMFVQHILAVLQPDGIGATVMPHGVLFRGGDGGHDPQGHHRGRPAGGGHRPGLEPVLRHRHPGLHPGAARHRAASCRAEAQGAVHQRRPRVHRWQGAELPGPAAHREDRQRLRTPTRTSPASPASWTSTSWRRTTTTSTSAATSTTPPRPSRRTSAPTCTAASRSRRSRPTRRRSAPTASTCGPSSRPRPPSALATCRSLRPGPGAARRVDPGNGDREARGAPRRVRPVVGRPRQAHHRATEARPHPRHAGPP